VTSQPPIATYLSRTMTKFYINIVSDVLLYCAGQVSSVKPGNEEPTCPVGEHLFRLKLLKTDKDSPGWGDASYFIIKLDMESHTKGTSVESSAELVAAGTFIGKGCHQITSCCLASGGTFAVTLARTPVVGQQESSDQLREKELLHSRFANQDIGVEICESTFVGKSSS
jgi:hypothetical protein